MSAFPCPITGCTAIHTDVIDTRPRPGKIWRKRQCSNGHRFSTLESHHDHDDRRSPIMPVLTAAVR